MVTIILDNSVYCRYFYKLYLLQGNMFSILFYYNYYELLSSLVIYLVHANHYSNIELYFECIFLSIFHIFFHIFFKTILYLNISLPYPKPLSMQ